MTWALILLCLACLVTFLFCFFKLFKMHFITVYRSGCQNCWYKQESRCVNNAMVGLDIVVLHCLSNLNMGREREA